VSQSSPPLRGCIQKFTDWLPGARTANGTALCHWVQLYRYFVSQSSEFCRHSPLCCFSSCVYCCLFRYRISTETFGYTLVYVVHLSLSLSSYVTVSSNTAPPPTTTPSLLPLTRSTEAGTRQKKKIGQQMACYRSEHNLKLPQGGLLLSIPSPLRMSPLPRHPWMEITRALEPKSLLGIELRSCLKQMNYYDVFRTHLVIPLQPLRMKWRIRTLREERGLWNTCVNIWNP
jgi:hypothetical protein